MQIHELDNFTGSLGSGAFLAVDNGNDTGKISTDKLLEGVSSQISELDETVNERIDNIIAGGDAPSEAEIIDARLGGNGVSYASLGDAIRGQYAENKGRIEYDEEAYSKSLGFTPIPQTGEGSIPMNKSVGGTINMSDIRSTAGYYYWIVPCSENDVFVINGAGGGWTWRLWAFVDSNGVVLAIESNTATLENYKLVAPADSAYLIMNSYGLLPQYKGDYTNIEQRLTDVETLAEKDSLTIKNKIEVTSTGTKPYILTAGKVYEITNNTSDTITVRTRLSPSSSNIEYVSVNPNATKDFTCGVDADGVNIYSAGSIDVIIQQKDTIDYRITGYDSQIAAIRSVLVDTNRDISDSIVIEKINTITKAYFPTKIGETYKITNYGEWAVSFRTHITSSGADVAQMTVVGGGTVVWTCDVDANYVSIYGTHDYTVSVDNVNSLDYKISVNAKSIDEITGKIPSYYEPMMATKLSTIRDNMNEVGQNGDTFVFITDLHWQNNAKNSLKLVKYIMDRTNINKIVCGGDIIGGGERTPMMNDMITVIKGLEFPFHNDLLVCFGNHDSNKFGQQDQTARHFDLNTCYALMEKESESYITMMTDYDLSFYYDDPANQTRYIVLDMGEDMGEANRRFTAYQELANTLLDTESGWNIIIVAHIVTYGRFLYIEEILDAYNSRGTYTRENVGTFDFAEGEGTVIFAIGGHDHIDSDHTTADGIPVIVTDCDSYRTESEEYPYVKGTDQEQCFDVVTVDYTNQTIKFTRIGRGVDRSYTY